MAAARAVFDDSTDPLERSMGTSRFRLRALVAILWPASRAVAQEGRWRGHEYEPGSMLATNPGSDFREGCLQKSFYGRRGIWEVFRDRVKKIYNFSLLEPEAGNFDSLLSQKIACNFCAPRFATRD